MQQVTTEEGTSTYDYDVNGRGVKRSTPGGIERGNMTARVENGVSWTHTYNAENRLASMTDVRGTQWSTPAANSRTEFAYNETVGTTTWLFSYDGDGTLVGQLVTDNLTATHTAFFMGGGYEVISDGVTETVRKYYALAGSTFGMSDNGVMKYLISDHLPFQGASRGSTVAITDNTGNVLAETRYAERSGALRHFHVLDQVAEQPFGEPRVDAGSLASTDKTYTGQRDVPDTGLMDYKARMYSSGLGRFIQPDTIVPGAGISQAWNRYAYGLNNPVRYIDPSGHKACVDWDNNGQCVADPDWHGKNNPLPNGPYKKGKNGKGVKGGNRFGGQVTISRAGFPELPDYVWYKGDSEQNGYTIYQKTKYLINSQDYFYFYNPQKVSWNDIYIDLFGIVGDLVPIIQPAAEGTEFIKILKDTDKLVGLTEFASDIVAFIPNSPIKPDLPTTIFDFLSLIPTLGAYPSLADIIYQIHRSQEVIPINHQRE